MRNRRCQRKRIARCILAGHRWTQHSGNVTTDMRGREIVYCICSVCGTLRHMTKRVWIDYLKEHDNGHPR